MTSATMEDSEFGDFNSAFPSSEIGERNNLQSRDAVFKDVEKPLPAGTHPPQSDDFSMNWEFEDFQCFPTIPETAISFSPSTLGTLPDIPPLPEDLQVQFCHGGDGTMNITDATSRQTATLKQTKEGVDTATSFAVPVNNESKEFKDFEYSTQLNPPWMNNQPELEVSSVSGQCTCTCTSADESFVTMHNFL